MNQKVCLLILTTLLFSTCKKEESLKEKLEIAKTFLENGEPSKAKPLFEEVLKNSDESATDSRSDYCQSLYGVFLSNIMMLFDSLGKIDISKITSNLGLPMTPPTRFFPKQQTIPYVSFDLVFAPAIKALIDFFDDSTNRLNKIIEKECSLELKKFHFKLLSMEIEVKEDEGGVVFNPTFARIFNILVYALKGALKILYSINFDISGPAIYDFLGHIQKRPSLLTTDIVLDFGDVIAKSPNFGRFHKERKDFFEKSRFEFANSLSETVKLLDDLVKVPDIPKEDILRKLLNIGGFDLGSVSRVIGSLNNSIKPVLQKWEKALAFSNKCDEPKKFITEFEKDGCIRIFEDIGYKGLLDIVRNLVRNLQIGSLKDFLNTVTNIIVFDPQRFFSLPYTSPEWHPRQIFPLVSTLGSAAYELAIEFEKEKDEAHFNEGGYFEIMSYEEGATLSKDPFAVFSPISPTSDVSIFQDCVTPKSATEPLMYIAFQDPSLGGSLYLTLAGIFMDKKNDQEIELKCPGAEKAEEIYFKKDGYSNLQSVFDSDEKEKYKYSLYSINKVIAYFVRAFYGVAGSIVK